jgi:hypothetical protein
MLVKFLLTEYGIPKTGMANVIIDAWDLTNDSLVIDDAAVSEVGGGFYKYDHTAYDHDIEYGYIAYAASLPVGQRYAYGYSTVEGSVKLIQKALLNRMRIDINTKTLIIYDDDGTTPLKTFYLKDILGNLSITNYFEKTPV